MESDEIEKNAILKLKEIRTLKKLSQLELSNISGVSQNMITYIENLKRHSSLITVIKLCKAMNVPLACLFEDTIKTEKLRTITEIEKLLNDLKTQ